MSLLLSVQRLMLHIVLNFGKFFESREVLRGRVSDVCPRPVLSRLALKKFAKVQN